MIHTRWYDEVKELTERLMRINSISPSVAGENACATEIEWSSGASIPDARTAR